MQPEAGPTVGQDGQHGQAAEGVGDGGAEADAREALARQRPQSGEEQPRQRHIDDRDAAEDHHARPRVARPD